MDKLRRLLDEIMYHLHTTQDIDRVRSLARDVEFVYHETEFVVESRFPGGPWNLVDHDSRFLDNESARSRASLVSDKLQTRVVCVNTIRTVVE